MTQTGPMPLPSTRRHPSAQPLRNSSSSAGIVVRHLENQLNNLALGSSDDNATSDSAWTLSGSDGSGAMNGRSLHDIAEYIQRSRASRLFSQSSSREARTEWKDPSPIIQLSNYHRAMVYDELGQKPTPPTETLYQASHQPAPPRPPTTSHQTGPRITPEALLSWTAAHKARAALGPLGVRRGIDYGMILSVIWGNIWEDPYKYIATLFTSILLAASPQLPSQPGHPCMHLTELETLLYNEANENALLHSCLVGLKAESSPLAHVFLHPEISPFFYLKPSEIRPTDAVLYINTDKICEAGQKQRENEHGPSAMNKRFRMAQAVLRRAGLDKVLERL